MHLSTQRASDDPVRTWTAEQMMQTIKYTTCAICGSAMIFGHEMNHLECAHVAHIRCAGKCTICYHKPPSGAYGFMLRVLRVVAAYTPYGIMGDAHAASEEYRRSVMMASTLGLLWLFQPVTAACKKILRRDPESVLYFFVFVWRYEPFVGTTISSCLALWISGAYGSAWGFVPDAAVCVAATTAFKWSDVTGSLAVFTVVFLKIWRAPSMWDVHWGNCFGAWSVLTAVLFSAFLSAVVASSLVHETFNSVGILHANLVVYALFNAQTADPFTPQTASLARKLFWGVFVSLLVLGKSNR